MVRQDTNLFVRSPKTKDFPSYIPAKKNRLNNGHLCMKLVLEWTSKECFKSKIGNSNNIGLFPILKYKANTNFGILKSVLHICSVGMPSIYELKKKTLIRLKKLLEASAVLLPSVWLWPYKVSIFDYWSIWILVYMYVRFYSSMWTLIKNW